MRANLDLCGLSVALDMTLIGDELAFLCEGLNLADAVAGCLLFEACLDLGRQGIEGDLFLNLGDGAVGREENVAGAAVDDHLDLVEGLAVLTFFGEALDGGAPGLPCSNRSRTRYRRSDGAIADGDRDLLVNASEE